jgi:cell division protein FtsW
MAFGRMKSASALNSPIHRFCSDIPLLVVCVALLMIGFVMMTSASLHLGAKYSPDNIFYYPLRQFIHIVLGVVMASIIVMLKMEFWEKFGPWLFIVGLGLLVLVLIPGLGVKVNGSMRWLAVAGVRIQVSELIKLIAVIYMAGYVTRHQDELQTSAYGLLRPLLLFAFACLLLLLEPDFGAAVVILSIALGVMFLSGAKLWQFGLLLILLCVSALLLVVFSRYRLARVTGFMDPWADPLDTGFQLVQALISFGRGGWFGVGLGDGIQKLFYLPEAHTDFIFSVLAEELGLIGVVTIIGLFSMLIWRAFKIGLDAEACGQRFSAYVAYGLGIWFGLQAFINMGVNMGILPTKGLTLPLMSYGGGSMVIMCSALALLFRIQSETVAIQVETVKGIPLWANAS